MSSQGWRKAKFDDLVRLKRGYDLPNHKIIDGPYPVVTSSDVKAFHSEYKVEPPGVVTGRSGTLGVVQYVKEEYWPLNTALYAKDFRGNVPEFVYYYLQVMQLENFNAGAGVPTLNQNHLHKIPVIIPPPEEQTKIAAILFAYDELIENNKRRIVLLEKMAEEIYREWFVRFRFPGYQTTEFEKGIPKGWKLTAINQLCKEVRQSVKKKDLEDDGLYIGLEHIPRKSISITSFGMAGDVDSDKLRFREGDILFGKIRPYLHKVSLAHISGACSTDTIVLRPTNNQVEGFLLFTVFSNTFIELATTASKGTKMPRADWGFLKKQEIVTPPEALLKRYQSRFAEIFGQIKTLLACNVNLQITKRLLLRRLISGRLDVRAMDIQLRPSMSEDEAA